MRDPTAPTRAPVVRKLGGAALADGASVRAACERVRARGACVLVVSAALGVTDALLAAAEAAAAGERDPRGLRLRHRALLRELALDPELCDRHLAELAVVLGAVAADGALTPQRRDHVLGLGERISARIVAAVLRSMGERAVPMDAFDLGLATDSRHGEARPLPGSDARLRASLGRALDSGLSPVVTGFIGADASGRVTTLGRDGSDLSAALVAAALGARELELWKPVAGVLTADPRLVPEARPLRALSYGQAAAMAALGAKVLHPAALAPLAAAGIPARVLCFATPDDAGTRIGEGAAAGPVGIAVAPLVGGRLRLSLVGGAELAREAGVLLGSAARALPPQHDSACFAVRPAALVPAARALHARFLPALLSPMAGGGALAET